MDIPDAADVSTPSGAHELLGEGSYTFEVGAEFIHGESTVLMRMARELGTGAKQLFTWAQGDGGPSDHAAPDGGAGYYWLGAEQKLLRFDEAEADKDVRALHEQHSL